MEKPTKSKGMLKRLEDGEHLVVAEGYLFAFERRGYLKAGHFVPEVVLEHPELVRQQYEEFVHAGSDVILAFTYYGHREKLKLINREDDLEQMNRKALRIAREVADAHNCLMAGNICNTTIYDSQDASYNEAITEIFKEQIEWAVEEGADYILAETFTALGEAKLALDAIKRFGKGLAAVVTLAPSNSCTTFEGVSYAQACRELEDEGAAVVGLNCFRGPSTMLPLLQEIRLACKGPIAALPVPYRTHSGEENFISLRDPDTGSNSFPDDLDRWYCSRTQIAEFGRALLEIGVQYVGLCCGANAGQLRALAQAIGRDPPANKYSKDMTKHFLFSNLEKFKVREAQRKGYREKIVGGAA